MKFMNRLERLEVGLDLDDDGSESPDELLKWNEVFERVLSVAQCLLGEQALLKLETDRRLREGLGKIGETYTLEHRARVTMARVLRRLTEGELPPIAGPIKYEAIVACDQLGLPSPHLELDEA
jgi:hypothetical protein